MSNITKISIESTATIKCDFSVATRQLIFLEKDFTKREIKLNSHPLIWVKAPQFTSF